METSDTIDNSWDTTSDTTTTAMRSDPLASEKSPLPPASGWMVNIAGRDIVEMSHADVMSKLGNGELTGGMLVWREGMDNWARLESVPAFQTASKPATSEAEPNTERGNFFPVYERPAATLVFDEAVEAEWKGTPKAPETSTTPRGSAPSKATKSVTARPPAPSLPPLAPRRNPTVPADEAPPPPPLPPRKQPAPLRTSTRPPQPTIPGGITAPTPRPPSVAPAGNGTPVETGAVAKSSSPPAVKSSSPPAIKSSSPSATTAAVRSSQPPAPTAPKSPLPQATSSGQPSSPLLAAIAAAATNPEPVAAAAPAPAAVSLDELGIGATFRTTKSVSLRNAALACAASALLASLVTGLIVGSGSKEAARRPAESKSEVAAVATVAPSPPPPAPLPVAPPPTAEPDLAKAEKAPASEPEVEKPKPKPVKVSSYKPPKVAAPEDPGAGEADKLAPNPERDDPVRAVPAAAPSAADPNWQADPGF
jgi:F0F1-type ATP synthase membrane subunit c/vacuolar-type H+-ATPase subunit K